jgi:hypothetical protein
MEGAAWAENVPFSETRDYVKKVLSNTTFYAAILTGQPQSLKARLGMIGPRARSPSPTPTCPMSRIRDVVAEFSDLGDDLEQLTQLVCAGAGAFLGGCWAAARNRQAGRHPHPHAGGIGAIVLVPLPGHGRPAGCCRACWPASASSAPAPS